MPGAYILVDSACTALCTGRWRHDGLAFLGRGGRGDRRWMILVLFVPTG